MFEYLIESFKTYKPMLASIKNEYEMMLAHQRDEIQRLLPLQVYVQHYMDLLIRGCVTCQSVICLSVIPSVCTV